MVLIIRGLTEAQIKSVTKLLYGRHEPPQDEVTVESEETDVRTSENDS